MNLAEYQQKAFATGQIDWNDARKRHIPAFGVVGELGSITSELKKLLRDGRAYTEGRANLMEEFGDLLWYIGALASRNNLVLENALERDAGHKSAGSPYRHIYAMVGAFADLIAIIDEISPTPSDPARQQLAATLNAALRATLIAIKREKLDLAEVLWHNLRKVKGMFGTSTPKPARCFDSKFPGYERLPRSMNIHFLERERGLGRLEVVLRVNNLNIGDRLTDNTAKDDGYRYHDAFHLAYCAVLGWSPVVRATFRCKRKSDSRVDEVQDGARAAIVEEAIAQTVFNYARGHSMLKGLNRIDHNILKLIQRMVRGFEVQDCALHEWQRAIVVGFEAFRALKKNRGGWLILDAETQSLTYSREGPVVG